MNPGTLRGTCSKTVYLKDMGAIGDSPNYLIQLNPGTYRVKHGLFGSWVTCNITSGQSVVQNF